MDMPEDYRQIYIDEAKESLIALNNLVLKLEKSPEDKEIVEEIFRRIHLLKGSSAMIGVEGAAKIAHEVEDILIKVKSGELKVTSELIDVLLESLDSISKAVNAFSEGRITKLNDDLIVKIRSLTKARSSQEAKLSLDSELSEEEKTHLQHALNKGLKTYLVRVKIISGGIAPIRAFTVLQKLSENGEIIKTIPDGERIVSGEFDGRLTVLVAQRKESDFRDLLKEVPDVEKVDFTAVSIEELGLSPSSEPVKREATSVDRVESLIKRVEEIVQDKKSLSVTNKAFVPGFKHIEEVRVKVKDLDRIFTLIGELVLVRNRFLRIESIFDAQEIKDAVASLNQTTNDLYTEILKMRLISVGQLFNAFPRLVRDLAKELGKQVDFIIEGEDTMLDRSVLEELIDPLTGLIRNALDHGVESPEERLASGKPKIATVKLSARREGEFTMISVEDDGRGIDVEYVKQLAIKRGIIPRSVAENLSDEEAINIICLPGFSTKDSASMVSGRGMGLSAIKQKIESLGGYIEIKSEKGKGTRVTMTVPTNVSIQTVLLVESCGQVYAIPLSSIISIVKLSDESLGHAGKQLVLAYRDLIMPLYSLSRLLNMNSNQPEEYGVILKKGDKFICIAVSKLLGLEDVTVKSNVSGIMKMPWISGVTILSNGQVSLIIDPWHLISESEGGWKTL